MDDLDDDDRRILSFWFRTPVEAYRDAADRQTDAALADVRGAGWPVPTHDLGGEAGA